MEQGPMQEPGDADTLEAATPASVVSGKGRVLPATNGRSMQDLIQTDKILIRR